MSPDEHVGLVSVITPCFNAEAFVRETIESVLAQTHPRVEHIVVDDASTDASWDVVRGYAARGIVGMRLDENRGASHARNRGAAMARGEFLMFLDADDLLAPGALAALVAAVRDRPGALGVCSWRWLRQNRRGMWEPTSAGVPPLDEGADHLRGWLAGSYWAPPCAVLWRRDVYERTGGWDEELTLDDDADLAMRALADGATLVPAPEGMAYYRSHGSTRLSVSVQMFSSDRIASRVRIVDKLAALFERRGESAEYAVALGTAYQRAALVAYQQGLAALGREYQARGERLAGRQAVSRTRLGRALCWLVGLERKERLSQALAAWGIGPRSRRDLLRLRSHHGES